jgi:hypothetical protein
VRLLQGSGVHVLAASGRRPASVKKVLQANDLMLASVCLDGALGRDFGANEDFHSSRFAPEGAADVLERFRSIGVEPVVSIATPDDRDCVLGPSPSTHPNYVVAVRDLARRADLRRTVFDDQTTSSGLRAKTAGPSSTGRPDGDPADEPLPQQGVCGTPQADERRPCRRRLRCSPHR